MHPGYNGDFTWELSVVWSVCKQQMWFGVNAVETMAVFSDFLQLDSTSHGAGERNTMRHYGSGDNCYFLLMGN